MNKENKLNTYNHLNDMFRVNMLSYDEGILSHDVILAETVWRNLMEMREIKDYGKLAEMCEYIRKNVHHLETNITEIDLIKKGLVTFVPFDQSQVDHNKVREKIIEKLKYHSMT
jgi:hypothetical protein